MADSVGASGSPHCNLKVWKMRDIIIEIVKTIPAALAAFGAIVRFGADDDARLDALEKHVEELRDMLREVSVHIQAKKLERTE